MAATGAHGSLFKAKPAEDKLPKTNTSSGAGEAEAQFRALAGQIEAELASLLGESDRFERQRLEAISTVLKSDGAVDLVKRLDEYAAGLGSGEGEER